MKANGTTEEEEDIVGDLPNIKSRHIGKQSISLEEVVEVRENVTIFKAPDGGYGWVIVVIGFLCLSLVDGFIYSYGAFYTELQEVYQSSIMSVMMGGFMLIGFACFSGPFVASLANKLGFKIVMIIGAVSFFLVSCFSSICQSITSFNFVMGFLGGVSLGFVMLPGYTVFSVWFDKHRAIACSLTLGGSGFGCIIYPLVIDSLIDLYGLRGCLLLIGAFNLNQIVLALLIRDPMKLVKKANETPQNLLKQNNFMSTDIAMPLSQNCILSHNSIFHNSSQVIPAPSISHSTNLPFSSILSFKPAKNRSPSRDSKMTLNEIPNTDSTNVAIIGDSGADFVPEDIPCIEQSAYIAIINKALNTDQDPNIPVITEENFVTSMQTIHSHVETEDVNKIRHMISKEISRPFVRQDIFLPSSTWNISSKCHERGSLSSLDHENITGNIVITERDIKSPIFGILYRIFQFELFKKPSFILMMLASLFTSTVTLSTPQTMKQYANSIQISRSHSSMFISVYGIGLLVSKPFLGMLTNYISHSEISYFASSIMLTIFTGITGFISNPYYIISYGIVLALGSSNMTNLRSLLIAEYMPPNMITAAFGWSLMMAGISMIIAPFVAMVGSTFDLYWLSFLLGAALIFAAGLMIIIILGITQRKKNNSEPIEIE